MNIAAISPGLEDRAAFVGTTGGGKTTLARVIIEPRRNVVVYDAKGLIRWPGWRRFTSLRKLVTARPDDVRHAIYAPSYEELADPQRVDAFFAWIYRRGNCTCYVDEIYAIARGDVFPFHYGAILTRGRERGISTLTSTQRPSRVPQIMFSESEHVYVFRLRMPQDRDKIEEVTSIDARTIARIPKYQFMYARQDADPSGPYVLPPAAVVKRAA